MGRGPLLPASHRVRFGEGLVPPRARLRRNEVAEWLERTRSEHPTLRRQAVQALCPCHVRNDVPEVWSRILAMKGDEDAGVRRAVFHALTDGSPRALESEVVGAIEAMRSDPDPRLRRRVRRFLAGFRRTGRVNVN